MKKKKWSYDKMNSILISLTVPEIGIVRFNFFDFSQDADEEK